MEALGIPFYDDDLMKMLLRFAINSVFISIIIWFIYYRKYQKKDYLFTYFMVSIIVFFICFTLKKFELDLGMALGLFAIFGILRYRTAQIEIREMTYLFIVIGISVINALSNKKMSYTELMFANTSIVFIAWLLEGSLFSRTEVFKSILYEKIDNVKPENYSILKADLEERTGIKIHRIVVDDIDFLKDVSRIRIYYYLKEQHKLLQDNMRDT